MRFYNSMEHCCQCQNIETVWVGLKYTSVLFLSMAISKKFILFFSKQSIVNLRFLWNEYNLSKINMSSSFAKKGYHQHIVYKT